MDRKELLAERRKLKKQVARLAASLAAHEAHLAMRRADPTYKIGKYVSDLGSPAVGPCFVVDDRAIRDVIRTGIMNTASWPKGAVMCHRCDTPHCVQMDHIFPGTHQDNMRDCALKGRWSRKVVARKEQLTRLRAQLMAVELILGCVQL